MLIYSFIFISDNENNANKSVFVHSYIDLTYKVISFTDGAVIDKIKMGKKWGYLELYTHIRSTQ